MKRLARLKSDIVDRARRGPTSLRVQLFVLSVVTTTMTAFLVGLGGHYLLYGTAHARALETLRAEALVNAANAFAPLDDLRRETKLLSRLPAVTRLTRTEEPRPENLHVLIGSIVTGLLNERDAYTQARVILLTDGGREYVRVNNTPDGPVPVPPDKLQRKGSEPYMQPLVANTASQGYFSHLSLNREHGQTEEGAPATLRYIQPLLDANGNAVGAVVLNADFEKLMRDMDRQLRRGYRQTLLTDQGDHMTSDGITPSPRLHFHEDPEFQPFRWPGEGYDPAVSDASFEADGTTSHVVSRRLPGLGSTSRLSIITSAPTDLLLAPATQILRLGLLLTALALMIALLLAYAIWSWSTHPLKILEEISDDMARNVLKRPMNRPVDGAERRQVFRMAETFIHLKTRLLAEGAQLRAIFRHAVDGILVVDRDGTIVDLNPAARQLFGEIAVKGGNIDVLVPEELRARHANLLLGADVDSTGRRMAATRDIEAMRADGSRVPVEISISPLDHTDHTLFVAMIRDISDRHALDQAREQMVSSLTAAKEELERSNAELDNFAYVASHDLKAPLRVIDNASRWLEEDLEAFLEDDTRESMALLRNRVARMERLLDDLLQHSRIGRDTRTYAPIGGAELMDVILGLVALPQGFRVEVDDSLAGITLPRMPIQNVLLNLVSNAIKHHDRSDGHVRVSVETTPNDFIFTVADDGPGIAEEYHQRVFGMFTTLRPRDEVEGSGMGLAMVRKTVDLAGGSVTLESAPGRGCRFQVRWPRPRPDTAKARPDGEAA